MRIIDVEELKKVLEFEPLNIKTDGSIDRKTVIDFLSDMTKEELEEALNPERGEWLKGAVIHLSQCLHEIGDQFGIVNAEVEG